MTTIRDYTKKHSGMAGSGEGVPSKMSRAAAIRRTLLAMGIIAPWLYVVATILGALRWQGYDFTSQSVSELFAIDAPSKLLVDPLLLGYSVLWIAFGVGVWQSAGPNRALRIVAVGLIGKEVEGAIVQLFFPMHLRGVAVTANDPLHGILTYLGVICFLAAMGAGTRVFGKGFGLYSLATLLVGMAFAILTGTYIPAMLANQPTPWMGIYERITIFSYLLWGAVLAARLLRRPDRPA